MHRPSRHRTAILGAIAFRFHAFLIVTMGAAEVSDLPGTKKTKFDPVRYMAAAGMTLPSDLDIWDADANLYLLMPDGSIKIDGEAVA